MKDPNVIIVLGGGTDGTLNPILYTKERITAALEVINKYSSVPVIVSGGYSTWMQFVPHYRESEVMKHFFVGHSVPKSRIIVERESRDTIGNLYFSKLIIKKHRSWKHILIITTKGHESRVRWTFRRIFGNGYSVSCTGVETELKSFANNPRREAYERYIQRLINKEFFRGMKDGDDRKLGAHMMRYHPGHSRSSEAQFLARKIAAAKLHYLGYTELREKK
ncbi:MAG: YdcF family protein [Patescibacteria group bacterium]